VVKDNDEVLIGTLERAGAAKRLARLRPAVVRVSGAPPESTIRTDVDRMWDELFQFLFNQNSILGWEYQNWMLVIGLPIVIFLLIFRSAGGSKPRGGTPTEAA
jgi:hypothetical protein